MGRRIEDLSNNMSGYCIAPGVRTETPPSGAEPMFHSCLESGLDIIAYACGATYKGYDEATRKIIQETCEGCPGRLPKAVGSVIEAVR